MPRPTNHKPMKYPKYVPLLLPENITCGAEAPYRNSLPVWTQITFGQTIYHHLLDLFLDQKPVKDKNLRAIAIALNPSIFAGPVDAAARWNQSMATLGYDVPACYTDRKWLRSHSSDG